MSSEFPSCFGTERVRMMHGCWTPKVDTLVPSSGLCGSENWQFAPQFMAKKTDNTAKHRDFVWGSFFCIQTNPICEPSQIVGVPLAIDSWTIVFPFKSARNLLKMEKGWLLEGFSYNYSNVPSNVCWAKNTAWFKMSTELLDFKEFLISWGFNYPPHSHSCNDPSSQMLKVRPYHPGFCWLILLSISFYPHSYPSKFP